MNKVESALFFAIVLSSSPAMAVQKSHDHGFDRSVIAASELQEIQSLESIRQSVESFIISSQAQDSGLEVKVKLPDNRLRLARCSEPLDTLWTSRTRRLGRVTVQVLCSAPKPWRIHVHATVTRQGEVWSLVRGVRRGDVLSRDMLVRQEVTLGSGNAAVSASGTPITDIDPWLGYAFAQRVSSGKIVKERMLEPAKVVRKGDAVVIRYSATGLELQTRGVALSDAGADQQTKVRNLSSGKVIDVFVVSPGTVEVLR